ncbi:zinc-binding metallopeptidase family protein [Paracidovorax sp. MALMAid1276]|uniref:zinc-binding metallopeptidase family protein n=1 Tax=Paracidovorax sp. MALMAid1276 TaxID=3411631 RepID=UPI003B9B3DFD
MRIFNCDHCGHLVFFDSVKCLNCGHALAFLPDALTMAALAPVSAPSVAGAESVPPGDPSHPASDPDSEAPEAEAPAMLWRRVGPKDALAGDPTPGVSSAPPGRLYRMCHNHTQYQACNFAIPADEPDVLCASCRQTRILPDLSEPANMGRWMKIEAAKRRLFYTLARLGLEPVPGRSGPVFEFLAELPGGPPVLTGHNEGTITLNVAEADDDERARRRIALREPYRTLIGHLRHESGHFYWDQLVRDGDRLDDFRQVFGDECEDYAAALEAHYAKGPDNGEWAQHHVSAYAAAHPWEDWAETWAHYLHMIDLLETAASYATEVTVPGVFGPQRSAAVDPFSQPQPDFDTLMQNLVPMTLLLNSLTRSLGQEDAYPFALIGEAPAKLRFVHDLVRGAASRPATAAPSAVSPDPAAPAAPAAAAAALPDAIVPSAPAGKEAGKKRSSRKVVTDPR